jgi:hypothetical protein
MPHIRILRHYIHTPYIVLAVGEAVVAGIAAYLGYYTRYQQFPPLLPYLPSALAYAVVIVTSIVAMGVYEARLREGFSAMMLRTAVAHHPHGPGFLFPACPRDAARRITVCNLGNLCPDRSVSRGFLCPDR